MSTGVFCVFGTGFDRAAKFILWENGLPTVLLEVILSF